jgi:hypothetical protein
MEINELNFFFSTYLFELETNINESHSLNDVKFHSEEANTDENLKLYFKEYFKSNPNLKAKAFKTVTIIVDDVHHKCDLNTLSQFQINNAYLPHELTVEQKKNIAKSKDGVYTNPDLYIEVTDGTNLYYDSIELKSTKGDKIPGSSVQQVLPFEWVIFVKRDKKSPKVSTGQYIYSITEKLPFPDRSPRPQVGFLTLSKWNSDNRTISGENLEIKIASKVNEAKLELLKDWQDYLASEWLNIVTVTSVKTTEKWFNNAIRKFALKFLEYNESLTKEELSALKENLRKLIT